MVTMVSVRTRVACTSASSTQKDFVLPCSSAHKFIVLSNKKKAKSWTECNTSSPRRPADHDQREKKEERLKRVPPRRLCAATLNSLIRHPDRPAAFCWQFWHTQTHTHTHTHTYRPCIHTHTPIHTQSPLRPFVQRGLHSRITPIAFHQCVGKRADFFFSRQSTETH